MKKAFFFLASTFLIFSTMYLILVRILSFTPKFQVISRFDDDLMIMKVAYDECKEGKGEKIGKYRIIEISMKPPQSKTHIKRKFLFDEKCKIKLVIY